MVKFALFSCDNEYPAAAMAGLVIRVELQRSTIEKLVLRSVILNPAL